jgi:hypothetical protein
MESRAEILVLPKTLMKVDYTTNFFIYINEKNLALFVKLPGQHHIAPQPIYQV